MLCRQGVAWCSTPSAHSSSYEHCQEGHCNRGKRSPTEFDLILA